MKILMLNPPTLDKTVFIREGRCTQKMGAWTSIWPPISLAQSAAVLLKHGLKVKLYDCSIENIEIKQLEEIINNYAPDIIVFSVSTPTIESDLKVVSKAKKIKPDALTVIFGTHPTVLPDECLFSSPELDVVIKGEPEMILENLILTVRDNKHLSEVKGISFRSPQGIVHNPPRPFLENLDELPFPAWDLVRKDSYRLPFTGEKFLMFASSRGCPYSCTFCTAKLYYGDKLRLRSPKKIVDELEWNVKKHGITNFLTWSETFTINKKFTLAIIEEIISRKLKIRWACNSRVDTIDKYVLGKLRDAGCWMISYGIESANQKILNNIKKNITIETAKKAVQWAKEAGLEVTGHFVLGLPGESKESIKETIRFSKSLDFDFVQFYCAVPFPGTEFYKEANQKKWITTTSWAMFDQSNSILNMNTIKADEVMAFRKKAYKQFYMQPKVIFKTLKKLKSFKELKEFIFMVKKFITWL